MGEVIPQAFKDNVDKVKEINSQNLGYELSYTGPFAALSEEEFVATYTGLDALWHLLTAQFCLLMMVPNWMMLWIGLLVVQSTPSRTKGSAVHAGHFPLWEHWKVHGRSV